jgi:hypothetical protein
MQLPVDVGEQVDRADGLFEGRAAGARRGYAIRAAAQCPDPVDDRAQGAQAGRGDPVRFHVSRWQPVFRLQAAPLAPACPAEEVEVDEAAHQNEITTPATKSLAVAVKIDRNDSWSADAVPALGRFG